MAAKSSGYSVKLTGPGLDFHRSIDEPLANRVINLIMTGTDAAAAAAGAAPGTRKMATPSDGGITPKAFLSQKTPNNDYEHIACLAYYLTNYREMPHFKTRDLTKLNTQTASSRRLSNPSQAVMHAAGTYHFLSAVGGGKKQITTLGEAVVDALPDREKVKAALADHKPRRPRKRGNRRKVAK
jgi:hypothetical protein